VVTVAFDKSVGYASLEITVATVDLNYATKKFNLFLAVA
jgi:hypothetical protein